MCGQLRASALSQREGDGCFPFSRSLFGPRAGLFSCTGQHKFESSGASSWEPQKLRSFDSWYCHNAVGFDSWYCHNAVGMDVFTTLSIEITTKKRLPDEGSVVCRNMLENY